MVKLTPADVQDAEAAEAIIKAIRQRWPWLKHLFADGPYNRGKLMSAAAYRNFVIEIVRSCPLWWYKSAGLFLISGWLGRFCQATAGSLTNGSWLNGAMVSRVM